MSDGDANRVVAEIERTQRVKVTIDVARYCAHWHKERAEFDGDDLAFVRESLEEEALDLLNPSVPVADGLDVREDEDDTEVTFLSPDSLRRRTSRDDTADVDFRGDDGFSV